MALEKASSLSHDDEKPHTFVGCKVKIILHFPQFLYGKQPRILSVAVLILVNMKCQS